MLKISGKTLKNAVFVLMLLVVILSFCNMGKGLVREAFGEKEKICYLTFDDGPSKNTEKILDILKEHQAQATFFVIGSEINEETKPLLQRMMHEGHSIGIHANVHNYETLYESLDGFLKDYETLSKKLEEECGIKTSLCRLPGGSACSLLQGQGKTYVQELEKRGYVIFDWKCTGEDSVGHPTVKSIQKNVFSNGMKYNTTIVLLHDSVIADATVEALPGILEKFEEAGYDFRSLEGTKGYVFPANR